MEGSQDKEKAGRKRACKNVIEPADKKKKACSETLQKSPLFGPTSPPKTTPPSTGLIKSPLFGGKPQIAMIVLSDLVVGSFRNNSIVGRITNIGEVIAWNNGRSQGKVVSFGIVNRKCEISVTIFNEKVEQFSGVLEINKVVEVCGFRVQNVEEKFRKVPGQGLEIVVKNHGSICESSEEMEAIHCDFKDILAINELPVGSLVDLLGIAYQFDKLVEGISTNGKTFAFRKIIVTDKTEMQFPLKVWGEQARTLALEKPTVFALRRGKVESFEFEKYVNISGSSLFWVSPPLKEAVELTDWLQKRLSQQ